MLLFNLLWKGKNHEVNNLLIRNRRTIRKFKPNPIDEEMLQMILEAGRWSLF